MGWDNKSSNLSRDKRLFKTLTQTLKKAKDESTRALARSRIEGLLNKWPNEFRLKSGDGDVSNGTN